MMNMFGNPISNVVPTGKQYSLGALGFLPNRSFASGTVDGVLGNLISVNPDLIKAVASWLTGTNYSNLSSATSIVRSALEATGGTTQLINIGQGGWDAGSNRARSSGGGGGGGGGGISISMGGGGYAGTSDMSASAMMSAYSSVLGTLQNWNLDSLTGKAWSMISDPNFHMNAGEVIDSLRNSPEYQAAFPGMAEIRAKGLSLTEQQYIARESDIMDQFSQNGVPQKMLTKDEMGKMVANGIYGSNLQTRIQKGYEAVKNADPMVKQMLQKWYGVRPGHLLGYMLSPKHGMNQIVKDVQAASIGTEAHLDGFRGVDQHTAQQLSKQMTTSGYNMDYFKTGFAKAAGEQPLEQTQIGQMGQATASKQQILAGTFAGLKEKNVGSQAEAQHAIDLASQARTAGLQGGGGYAQTAQGGLGIGSASTQGTGK